MAKKTKDNLFYEIASFVVNEQMLSSDAIKSKFNIDDKKLNTIVDQMEMEGIVSSLLDNNTRDVLMTEEDFSIIFNYKKPVVTDEKKIKKTSTKEIPLILRILLWLFLLFLIYLFSSRVIFVRRSSRVATTSTEPKVETQIGWIKNGNNWNYYDLNGNKKSNCLVDDGGKYYYFDDNGNMAAERWVEYNGKTFYVNKEGVMLKNQWIGDFYVGNDGNVLKNTTTPDGYQVGSDGRYIPKATNAKNVYVPTTIAKETVIHSINPGYIGYSVPNIAPENIVDQISNNEIIEPTAESINTSDIISPTAPAQSSMTIDNIGAISSGNNNYIIKSTNPYRQRGYLSNDRQCTVQINIPILADKNGTESEYFKEGMMQEQDNIISELIDVADGSIEEDDDDNYTSYKYISSISFQETRIKSQDDDSLVIREVGKCQWNTGKSTRIDLTIDYDKTNGSVSYYVED